MENNVGVFLISKKKNVILTFNRNVLSFYHTFHKDKKAYHNCYGTELANCLWVNAVRAPDHTSQFRGGLEQEWLINLPLQTL